MLETRKVSSTAIGLVSQSHYTVCIGRNVDRVGSYDYLRRPVSFASAYKASDGGRSGRTAYKYMYILSSFPISGFSWALFFQSISHAV